MKSTFLLSDLIDIKPKYDRSIKRFSNRYFEMFNEKKDFIVFVGKMQKLMNLLKNLKV